MRTTAVLISLFLFPAESSFVLQAGDSGDFLYGSTIFPTIITRTVPGGTSS